MEATLAASLEVEEPSKAPRRPCQSGKFSEPKFSKDRRIKPSRSPEIKIRSLLICLRNKSLSTRSSEVEAPFRAPRKSCQLGKSGEPSFLEPTPTPLSPRRQSTRHRAGSVLSTMSREDAGLEDLHPGALGLTSMPKQQAASRLLRLGLPIDREARGAASPVGGRAGRWRIGGRESAVNRDSERQRVRGQPWRCRRIGPERRRRYRDPSRSAPASRRIPSTATRRSRQRRRSAPGSAGRWRSSTAWRRRAGRRRSGERRLGIAEASDHGHRVLIENGADVQHCRCRHSRSPEPVGALAGAAATRDRLPGRLDGLHDVANRLRRNLLGRPKAAPLGRRDVSGPRFCVIHGSPRPPTINSGDRTPEHNAGFATATRNSMQFYGCAADLRVTRHPPRAVTLAA